MPVKEAEVSKIGDRFFLLQTFQHNLPILFWGSLHSRLSRHSRLLAEAPSLTNFRVQFYGGALQLRLSKSSQKRKTTAIDMPGIVLGTRDRQNCR